MPWTDPITWQGAQSLNSPTTADDLNVNVRDNVGYLYDQSLALMQDGAGTTIPNNTVTVLTFTAGGGTGILAQTADMTVTSSSTYTPTIPGLYQLWACFAWAGSAVGVREAAIVDTGLSNIAVAEDLQTGTGARQFVSMSGTQYWPSYQSPSPSWQVLVFQNSGAGLLIFGTATTSTNLLTGVPCQFGVRLIGSGV